METKATHIVIVLDRTGSMEAIRDDTIGGFNAFLEEQQAAPAGGTLTLVQFDSLDPYEVVYRWRPLPDAPRLTRETYVPRASTPLLDAMGRAIVDLEHSLAKLAAEDRPESVVMVVVTDGQENASREYRKEQVARMIHDKKQLLGWQFVFLSADLDAIVDAINVGVDVGQAMSFDRTGRGTRDALSSMSRRVVEYRQGRRTAVDFEEEDRKKQDSESQRKKP